MLLPWRDAGPAGRLSPVLPRRQSPATKLLCSYIWNAYGRFPATIDPFLMTVWYQAQHLDLGFYDKFYPHEALS